MDSRSSMKRIKDSLIVLSGSRTHNSQPIVVLSNDLATPNQLQDVLSELYAYPRYARDEEEVAEQGIRLKQRISGYTSVQSLTRQTTPAYIPYFRALFQRNKPRTATPKSRLNLQDLPSEIILLIVEHLRTEETVAKSDKLHRVEQERHTPIRMVGGLGGCEHCMCEVEELLEKRLAVPCEDSAAIKLSQTSRLLRGIIFDGMLVRSLRKVSLFEYFETGERSDTRLFSVKG
ncbi:hypothetical protein QFC20_007396 [Naganishia adeliensis]|uniref:Uncharacterized protein n=1 Tax=Naganishia adeliensis TaxID=92952 RepID=A0ACC2UZS8_9TREE|nr:hypothetical protein QFC20_007396 [Naganishia adeliensis]